MVIRLLLPIVLSIANQSTYLRPLMDEMTKKWPSNRTINIVFHGHSVPAGYFATPIVDTFNAYPHLTHAALKERFPYAVVNCIVTAIGGENSVSGAKRFEEDVLSLHPDLVCIDYGLNDRGLPPDQTKDAWLQMVRSAKSHKIKVLLFSPTPDQSAKMLDPNDPLSKQAEQIRGIAASEGVGLVDSYARFCQILTEEKSIKPYMSQVNHPNRKGHDEVLRLILNWFPADK